MTFRLSVYLLLVCIFHLISGQQPGGAKKPGEPWSAKNYPNPWTEPKRCGFHIPGFICDPDKMMSKEQALEIKNYLWEQGRLADCICPRCPPGRRGIPIGVALMSNAFISRDKSLDDEYPDNPDEDLDYYVRQTAPHQTWTEFAESLRKSWTVGTCENDALIVFSSQGGAVAFGNYTRKLLEGSKVLNLLPHQFMVGPTYQYEFIMKIIKEIQAHADPSKKPTEHQNFTMDLIDYPSNFDSKPKLQVPKIPENTVKPEDQIKPEDTIKPEISNASIAQTWGTNIFIAAAEDDDFETPPEEKIDSSLAFVLIISFTVLLVCLIALFLIIWYYRTKTGNIQPSAEYTKPPTDEKLPSDIKTVKYEPCQTEEPGLPV